MLPFKPVLNQTSKTRREHAIEEYKRMMDNFVDIFIVDLVSFKLKNATFQAAFCFIEYARRVGLEFGHAEIEILREKNEDYQKLLAVCSDASELSIDIWFTVNHMCAFVNCYQLDVDEINWRSEDYNEFLKFWIETDCRLNQFTFSNDLDLDLQIVLNGIHNIQRGEVFEIQRANGMRAEVTYDNAAFQLAVIHI